MKTTYPKLSLDDVKESPLWRFTNSGVDELEIESVAPCPGIPLDGLIVASKISLADGSKHWAFFQNISYDGEAVNEHYLTLTIWSDGQTFPLARYHDIAYEDYGPAELAEFMGKPLEDVFPISYDLRTELKADSPTLQGFVRQEPAKRLSKKELIAWTIERLADNL